ncbi:MAG TPA: alpha/beta hydrolase [Chloroflexia bacterium]|nr:alpha/beta hydrolase [Chloroflexia bacterium]
MLQHETATLNGVEIHYVRDGRGPTMLFLHGFPQFWYAWREQLDAFSADHQVVAPDLPGYNLSGKPDDVAAYAAPQVAAIMRALVDRVSPGQPVVLVGHDWGGIVAWAFAIAFPTYLSHLVIINAPHPAIIARELATNPAQQQAMGYAVRFRQPGAEALLGAGDYAALAGALFAGAARAEAFSPADHDAYRAAWAQPGALTGMLNYYRASALGPPPGSPAPDLTVRAPTLVLWGEQDRALLTGNLDGLEAFVPDLQVQRIPAGTHWVVHEEGPQITAAIRAFITPASG